MKQTSNKYKNVNVVKRLHTKIKSHYEEHKKLTKVDITFIKHCGNMLEKNWKIFVFKFLKKKKTN